MINGLIITNPGLEAISAEEIKELVKATNVKTSSGKITFSCTDYQALIDLCYHGRTFTKVMLLLDSFSFEGMPAPRVDNLPFVQPTILVDCERIGEHGFTSADVSRDWSLAIVEKYSVKMNWKKPLTTYFLLIEDDNAWFGVDFSGKDLGRRDYRIFLGTESLKGTIAAGILKFAEYEPKKSILDPFCRHGIIPIEAALIATNTSPNLFGKEKFAFANLSIPFELTDKPRERKGIIISLDDNFKNVSSAQKNAKIAGVVKSIDFSRTDLKWLDAKFGKNFLDMIVTMPAQPGKILTDEIIKKIAHQFFYQAEFIMKKTGTVCLCLKRGHEIYHAKAVEFGFKQIKSLIVTQGGEQMTFVLYSRV